MPAINRIIKLLRWGDIEQLMATRHSGTNGNCGGHLPMNVSSMKRNRRSLTHLGIKYNELSRRNCLKDNQNQFKI